MCVHVYMCVSMTIQNSNCGTRFVRRSNEAGWPQNVLCCPRREETYAYGLINRRWGETKISNGCKTAAHVAYPYNERTELNLSIDKKPHLRKRSEH